MTLKIWAKVSKISALSLVKLAINKADATEAWNIEMSISTPKHEWKMVPVGIKDHFLICNGKWFLTGESHEL